ncbi:MAG: ribonuclease HII [Clostridia bacterium]
MKMFEFEEKFLNSGAIFIAGMDEAGRGPLAGAVCVACVIMPLEKEDIIDGIDDSKKLSEKKRELLYDKIINKAIDYRIEFVDEKIVDEINILNATKLGMKRCLEGLNIRPDIALIDAVKLLDVSVPCEAIVHGDARSYSIAAASILAKVARDRLVVSTYDKQFPEYGFSKHKGYGTKAHIEAIKKFGPCAIHRKTFIKHFWEA